MKKAICVFILACTTFEVKPMYSGGTIAGAAIAGFVGGFILGKLVPKRSKKKDPINNKSQHETSKANQKHKSLKKQYKK